MRGLVIMSAMLATGGCISVSEARPAPPATGCAIGRPMVETVLYFGMARPGGTVSRYDFQQFMEREVAPRWKEGFTLLEGQGFWLSEQRGAAEHESSRVLVRLHDGSAASSSGIEAIRSAYVATFDQEAVLRTDRSTCADF